MAANPKSHTKRPEPFTGDRKKLEGFIRDCEIYVAANRTDFTTNESKSQFILSYIGGGEAESWKEHYYNTVIHRTPGTLTLSKNGMFALVRQQSYKVMLQSHLQESRL